MSTIGSFANKVFKVSSNHLYTFDDFTISGELKVDEQEVDGSKPSTYIKGSGLDKVSLNILLIKQKNVNVRNEIQDWLKIRDAKTPHHLIIGNKNLSSHKFLLTNVNTSDIKIGPNGEFLKSTVQLQFSEYVRAGKKKIHRLKVIVVSQMLEHLNLQRKLRKLKKIVKVNQKNLVQNQIKVMLN